MNDLDEILRWYEGNYLVPVMAKRRVEGARAEIVHLRSEVDRLTRVAQGNFDANTNTLAWTQPLIATLRARVTEVERERGELRQDGCWHGDKGHPCALDDRDAALARVEVLEAAIMEWSDSRAMLRSWLYTEPVKATQADTDRETEARYARAEAADARLRAVLNEAKP